MSLVRQLSIAFVLSIIMEIEISIAVADTSHVSEDVRFNFTALSLKYGRPCDEHDVVTKDGYILKVFNMPGDKKRPVFLMHGLMGTSDDFILRGNTSLAVTLSRAGYDVWAGNLRGNRYSRRHRKLVPDEDLAFWDYGPHEHGIHDLSSMIDYVLNKTGEKRLMHIGFSEGTTITFILTSTKPEYNEKLKVFIAIAPVAFLTNLKSPFTEILNVADLLNLYLKSTKQEEVGGYYSLMRDTMLYICSQRDFGYQLCMNGLLFQVCGFNPYEYEPEFVPVIFGHLPSGTSRKNLLQLAMIAKGDNFGQYDHGFARNMQEYGSPVPPQYNLKNVRVETHLLTAKNDRLSTLGDVGLLKKQLINVFHDHRMESASFIHVDFVWGRQSHKMVAQHIMDIFDKYNGTEHRSVNWKSLSKPGLVKVLSKGV